MTLANECLASIRGWRLFTLCSNVRGSVPPSPNLCFFHHSRWYLLLGRWTRHNWAISSSFFAMGEGWEGHKAPTTTLLLILIHNQIQNISWGKCEDISRLQIAHTDTRITGERKHLRYSSWRPLSLRLGVCLLVLASANILNIFLNF